MNYYAQTDIGKRRLKNQDCIFAGEIHGHLVFLIADGMGGHKSGEVASQMAIDIVSSEADKQLSKNPSLTSFLNSAVEKANQEIYRRSLENFEMEGMGTTFIAGIVKGNLAHIAHVGDSRAYLFNAEGLDQITKDHSLINELKDKNNYVAGDELRIRHIITRSLGTRKKITLDHTSIKLQEGDYLLFCTDGLTDEVSDREIEKVLKTDLGLQEKVKLLIDKAMSFGGKDNITLCLMKY